MAKIDNYSFLKKIVKPEMYDSKKDITIKYNF